MNGDSGGCNRTHQNQGRSGAEDQDGDDDSQQDPPNGEFKVDDQLDVTDEFFLAGGKLGSQREKAEWQVGELHLKDNKTRAVLNNVNH